jgi:hypothetical protein
MLSRVVWFFQVGGSEWWWSFSFSQLKKWLTLLIEMHIFNMVWTYKIIDVQGVITPQLYITTMDNNRWKWSEKWGESGEDIVEAFWETVLSLRLTGVILSHSLTVKIGLHTSKFHKLPIFPVFSQEKRPLKMVKQKHRYGKLMPLSQALIFI